MKMIIPSIKGTRDFYPELMSQRTWIYNTIRKVSESFGYQEYEAPILESIELYASKSGEELVNQQSFVFPDRGGDMIALRPEMTPSLARMVAQRQNQLIYPLRWWSYGPFWRYEKPQKGRTREFFQWNIDLIGPDSPSADAEMIALAASFFKQVGLSSSDVVILINDRGLTNEKLTSMGVLPEKLNDCLNLIDRRGKMEPSAWDNYAYDIGLNNTQLDMLKTILEDKELWKESPRLVQVFEILDVMGFSEYVQYDPNIIRGLLYYTSTVFEAFDRGKDVRRAILGGGRYDNLLAAVGGDPLPAVGFAMGDVVISLILEALDLIPSSATYTPASAMVTVFDQQGQTASLQLASELREAGIRVSCYPDIAKLPKQFKYADRMGIRLALVLGPDEISANQVTLKDLKDGSQRTIPRAELIKSVQALLASP